MPHQCTGCGHTFEDGSKEMLSGCPDCGGNKFQFRPAGASSDSDDAGASGESRGTPVDAEPTDPPGADPSSVAETVGRATTKVRDFVASDSIPPEPEPDAAWPDEWEGGSDPAAVDPAASSGDVERPRSSASDSSSDSGARDDDIIDADARRKAAERTDDPENVAQASARTDVVSSEELDGRAVASDAAGSTAPELKDEPDGPSPTNDGSQEGSVPDGEVVSEPTGEEPDLAELREQLNDQFESIKILEPGQYELNLMELYDREEYIIALQENGRYVIQVPEQWIGEDLDDR